MGTSELEAEAGFHSTLKSSPGQHNGHTEYSSFSACHKHMEETCCARNYTDTRFLLLSKASYPASASNPLPELRSQVPFIRAN